MLSDNVFQFPEYIALAYKLGIRLDATDVEITLTEPDEPVIITQDYPATGNIIPMEIVVGTLTGYELYGLPEFITLCKRLGIAWKLLTKSITITFKLGHTVTIKQVYNAGKYDSD